MEKGMQTQQTAQLATLDQAIISALVIGGDMKNLSEGQKVAFYNYRCQQAGLDPAAKPFDLLTLNGKQILYANATCTQQLCAVHKLSTAILSRESVGSIYMVCARVTGVDGRATENMGAVNIENLKGDSLANALMKATTKATRRTVLAHCGLGMLDETEAETIPNAVGEQWSGTQGEPQTLLPDVPTGLSETQLSEEEQEQFYAFYLEQWAVGLAKCADLRTLTAVYSRDEEIVEGDANIKALFTQRKKELQPLKLVS